jgi:hypothetical protein
MVPAGIARSQRNGGDTVRDRSIAIQDRGHMSNKDNENDRDHGKAAADASSGAESVVPAASGSGAAENPSLEAFKQHVAAQPDLQEKLAASTSDDHFAEQAVALGAQSGHHFSVFEALAHIAKGRAWASGAAADDDGDPEKPAPSTQTDTSCTTYPGYTHQGSCSFWQC